MLFRSGGHKFLGVIMGNREDTKNVKSVLNIHKYIVNISGEQNKG